jgi:hypothetical protein
MDSNWVRSTKCDNSGPNCAEVTKRNGLVMVRNSRNPEIVVTFDEGEWAAFTAGAAAGEF